jgi:hypothetical protein
VTHIEHVGSTRVDHERWHLVGAAGPGVDLEIAQRVLDRYGPHITQFKGKRLACFCSRDHCPGLVLAHLAEGTPVDCLDLFLRKR